MSKRYEAQLIITGRKDRMIATIYEAMSPETVKTTGGSKTTLSTHNGNLCFRFEADTIPALRALMNSYLRWLSMMDEVIGVLGNE